MLLYFGHSYIEGEHCKRGACERRSILKTFVVFNPAHLVESVLGILQFPYTSFVLFRPGTEKTPRVGPSNIQLPEHRFQFPVNSRSSRS